MTKTRQAFLLSAAILAASILPAAAQSQASITQTVIARELQGPRGLTFGPDGMLYVAEAGTGGTNSTVGTCPQVVPPVGPYKGGRNGRISRIDKAGNRTTVASGFASSMDALGGFEGVADLTFLDGTLYALIAGGGCSHGVANLPNAVVSVNTKNGSWKEVANLSKFLKSHPVKYPNPDDFEPDGTFYGMVAYQNELWVTEPNHGQVLRVQRDGDVFSAIDVSASQGHIVPTAITERDGEFIMGNLNQFPIEPNFARVQTLSFTECSRAFIPGLQDETGIGKLHIVGSKAGFTTVVGTEFGPDGLLYVLELSDAPGNPSPGHGKVVRVRANGNIEVVAAGLSVPTAMTFGPDGNLYVSNFGAAPPGAGQIVKIRVW
jgi:glucose/arabinose dehydrogenase